MSLFTVRASTLLGGARKLYDVLSDFDPDLERIEIDHNSTEASLYFGVEVPDSFLQRSGNTVDLERPVDFTLDGIRSKDQLHTYEIEQISGTEYRLPADKLDASEEYRLILSGRPSQTALSDLIRTDHFKGRIGRNQYEYNIVYNNGAVTWDDNTVVTVINDYRDEVVFDEQYLPRSLREKMPGTADEWHSEAWTTTYEPNEDTQDTSIDREDLPEEVRVILSSAPHGGDWWFSASVMGDYVTIEGPIDYYDLEVENLESPIPRRFTVVSRTDFNEKQKQTTGTIIFEKADFWKETRAEHLQKG